MDTSRRWTLALLLLLVPALAHAQPTTLVLEGDVPEEGRFFDVPFEVPAGVVELEVRHSDLSDANVLDWGLEDPRGFRGYGGGNGEPAVVGEHAASRSYLAGPVTPGTWRVTVGKARITEKPARYRIEVSLRTAPTLAPQPERRAYAPVVLANEARWYAGDLHVHSLESGDADAPLDEVARYAREAGLDFVLVSDHNTTATLEWLADAQARHPALLLMPGVEYTTYAGHANALGATEYVSPRLAHEAGLGPAADAFARQGALLSINHPVYDVGGLCIGCAWEHPVPLGSVAAVEVANGGSDRLGAFFDEGALAYWDWLLARGHHVAALGGSDDHRAGRDLQLNQSPIGSPTTRIFARGLSTQALIDGVRAGRTVVQLGGPGDPMVELDSSVPRTGDTVLAEGTRLSARVTGARGEQVRWVHDGVRLPLEDVTGDDVTFTRDVQAPADGEDRWRLEVWVGGRVRTVTSHVWVSRSEAFRGKPAAPPVLEEPARCGCSTGGEGALAGLALWVLARVRRRKH